MLLNTPPPVQSALLEHRLLKATEVQRILGLSRGNVYRLMKDEILPTVRIRGAIRVPYRDLVLWLESHTKPGPK